MSATMTPRATTLEEALRIRAFAVICPACGGKVGCILLAWPYDDRTTFEREVRDRERNGFSVVEECEATEALAPCTIRCGRRQQH